MFAAIEGFKIPSPAQRAQTVKLSYPANQRNSPRIKTMAAAAFDAAVAEKDTLYRTVVSALPVAISRYNAGPSAQTFYVAQRLYGYFNPPVPNAASVSGTILEKRQANAAYLLPFVEPYKHDFGVLLGDAIHRGIAQSGNGLENWIPIIIGVAAVVAAVAAPSIVSAVSTVPPAAAPAAAVVPAVPAAVAAPTVSVSSLAAISQAAPSAVLGTTMSTTAGLSSGLTTLGAGAAVSGGLAPSIIGAGAKAAASSVVESVAKKAIVASVDATVKSAAPSLLDQAIAAAASGLNTVTNLAGTASAIIGAGQTIKNANKPAVANNTVPGVVSGKNDGAQVAAKNDSLAALATGAIITYAVS